MRLCMSPTELQAAVFTAARLEAWPTTLRTAGRTLHHHIRSGGIALVYVVALMNLVARGLAEHLPEPAAVLQGCVSMLMSGLASDVAAAAAGGHSSSNPVAAQVVEVRRDTAQILTAALGEPRLRALRAEGAAMTEDQAYAYARNHIDEYLAAIDRDSNG